MKMPTPKRFISHDLRRCGVEMSHYTWPMYIEVVRPDGAFDIGANSGEYVEGLRAVRLLHADCFFVRT
jgi:hypothetical protein